MKYLMPLLILINCLMIQGILEWTVVGKVTEYGQNVTLFCNVPNCCPEDAGWDRWTPNQRTLFIDVKTGRYNKKYDGKVEKDGYTLIIQNLTKNDLNVSYSCLYGVTLGERKYLLEEDVFTFVSTLQPNDTSGLSKGELAALMTGVIVLVSVTIAICFGRRLRKKENEKEKRSNLKDKTTNIKNEQEELIPRIVRIENEQEEVIPRIMKIQNEQGEVIPRIVMIENEQKELNPRIVKIENEQKELIPRIVKIENDQEEVIPRNIRDLIKKKIQDWEEKDKMFVPTRASAYVMKSVRDKRCVTLTAPSGVGKSFISRHTALVLQKEGYHIIPVELPTEIKTYYQPGKKTVFIVDDICGNFTVNQQQIDSWKQLLPTIKTIIADQFCKIIVSCRLQVYKDEKFNILSSFKSCECNLISEEICLRSEEKKTIANTYFGTRMTDIDNLSQNCDFFPLLCSLCKEKEDIDVKEFFKNPFDVYKGELDRLSEHGDEGNYKICSLALCVLYNNQINEKWFEGKVTNVQRNIVDDTCEACKLNSGTSKAKLKEALDTLDGTFICKHNGIYRTLHDKLFDFLAHYFGQKMIECLINHGESDLVHERFIWQNSSDDKNSNIDFIIEIPDDYLESYLERLIKDWSAGKVSDVFCNNNRKKSSFRKRLLQYLLRLDKSQQEHLASTKDTVVPKENCDSGNTPLIITCYDGYTDMVQWLLHNDVNVDQCRDDGVTGLLMATQEGHTEIVKLLLERNAKVDLCYNDGFTPLIIACAGNHIRIAQLLIKHKPNINAQSYDGSTALILSSLIGNLEITHLLLKNNADCNICCRSKQSLIDILKSYPSKTLEEEKQGCFDFLIGNASSRVADYVKKKSVDYVFDIGVGCSPVHSACFMGWIDVVHCLLDNNANINMTKEDGTTPLFFACEVGHEDIVRLLLDKGADTQMYKLNGESPLNIATDNEHTSIVTMITNHTKKDEKLSF